MSPADKAAKLADLSQIALTRMGLYYPADRHGDLEHGVRAIAVARGFARWETCLEWLTTRPTPASAFEALAHHLTIGETYFFRHPEAFAALENTLIPELMAASAGKKRVLNVWCAGCSTGEEAYSVAILLKRLLIDTAGWKITIVATDIRRESLVRAEQATYGDWSFRGVSDEIRNAYFTEVKKGVYQLRNDIRDMVRFDYCNLAGGADPAAFETMAPFDLIFCRNVLIYLSPEHVAGALKRFGQQGAPGGWLITSPVETALAMGSTFSLVNVGQTTLLRNDRHLPPSVIAPPPASVTKRVERPVSANPTSAAATATRTRQQPHPSRQAPLPVNVDAHHTMRPRDTSSNTQGTQLALAERLYAAGQLAQALQLLTSDGQQRDNSAAVAALRARIHADLGQQEDALRWCEQVVAADCTQPGIYVLLASIRLESGSDQEAAEALRRALYLDAHCIMAHYTLGLVLRRLSRHGESARQFQEVLRLLDSLPPTTVVADSGGLTGEHLRDMTRQVMTIS